mmetsp:Transcript_62254/g.148570  ORF Transcript_62254/g.148570 Transcript_62254/m.148570 type:complete len:214 (+) Transcript_62254:1231-1872(+)
MPFRDTTPATKSINMAGSQPQFAIALGMKRMPAAMKALKIVMLACRSVSFSGLLLDAAGWAGAGEAHGDEPTVGAPPCPCTKLTRASRSALIHSGKRCSSAALVTKWRRKPPGLQMSDAFMMPGVPWRGSEFWRTSVSPPPLVIPSSAASIFEPFWYLSIFLRLSSKGWYSQSSSLSCSIQSGGFGPLSNKLLLCTRKAGRQTQPEAGERFWC